VRVRRKAFLTNPIDCRQRCEDIQLSLGRLPEGLEESYSVIYNQIKNSGEASREIARRALKWLLCQQRSFSTSEFLAVVTSQQEPADRLTSDDILSVCCNLVVLDSELDIFRFAHLSVREYLEKIPDLTLSLAHAAAAERCLQICLASSQVKERTNSGFVRYAILFWVVHYRAVVATVRRPPTIAIAKWT
jgi:hypothetical protein